MDTKYPIKTFYIVEEYQDIIKKLEEYAKDTNRSQSYIICEAIKEYMGKLDEEVNATQKC